MLSDSNIIREHAAVAQLVEHLICNQGVGGSIPSASTSAKVPSTALRQQSKYITDNPVRPRFVLVLYLPLRFCLDGGTGIHRRLKIFRPLGLAGSIPALGTG